MNEITINGETYVKKSQDHTEYFIVRTYSAGVFYGMIESRIGQEVVIKNARRIWNWEGAASLSELAMRGTSKPDECKFPVAVPTITVLETIEILPMTQVSLDSLNSVKEWSAQ